MKKVLASILLVLYITASSGIVINLHYCMNRLSSAKLSIVKSEICSKCGMESNDRNKCCHSEVKVIKIQDVQKLSELNYNFISFKLYADRPFVIMNEALASTDDFSFVSDHSPPISKQDTYLVNCVFRI